ncbi:hypothetical protein NEIMUCOT_05010 [Neisseria mucosa ATCC 25996]|uniref:Uncharacterized protein n=1 Tax=Neisseria mucosa (strain ATCC 25996 / DSM 4631 / NCTC 10774 / M26) TaxID=546266 RepID=D2ZWL3_NEIM2|nr:hypothetical protein NEIMUCOT_05010 [Neisseria mucosa ATCC 25996]
MGQDPTKALFFTTSNFQPNPPSNQRFQTTFYLEFNQKNQP